MKKNTIENTWFKDQMKLIKKVVSYPYETEEIAKEELQNSLERTNNAQNIKIVKMGSWYHYEYETEVKFYCKGAK